jgi:hypothetical protein
VAKIRDHLTYTDLAGRRRPRRYVLAAALVLGLLSLLAGWSLLGRAQAQRAMSPGLAAGEAGGAMRRTAEPEGATATATPDAAGCPADPERWRLVDVYRGDNYKRVEPACVYDGLAKAVAWQLLERLGYSKPEAAEQLGFNELPWQPAQTITGLTNTRGPLTIRLELEWAPHPAYRTWVVDAEGQPALAFSLRGCYRTRRIVGNEVETWGRYPVVCVVAYDRDPGWVVSELGAHRFSVDLTAAPPVRRFAFYGYQDGGWVLLGEPQDQQVAIEDPAVVDQERERVAARYGAVPWDAAWLAATFGVSMRRLPDGWQRFGADPAAIQGIAAALDAALKDVEVSP